VNQPVHLDLDYPLVLERLQFLDLLDYLEGLSGLQVQERLKFLVIHSFLVYQAVLRFLEFRIDLDYQLDQLVQ
jgi:hypothetical protein